MTPLPRHLVSTWIELLPRVPLTVYGVRGREYSVLIDTGIAQMRGRLVGLCHELGNVGMVLHTHAHVDHMGCNAAVKSTTGACFAAAGALPWFEDMETHYREFCLVSDDLPDSPAQREEILGQVDGHGDGAVRIDLLIEEGVTFRLDDDTELTTLRFPGHKLEEVGFLDRARGDLFMGDLLLALAAPFFHGYQGARAFEDSLSRLLDLIDTGTVRTVYAAHHPPMDAAAAAAAARATLAFLDEVEERTVAAAGGVSFDRLWRTVCADMGKQLEFRGHAMLRCLVDELLAEGRLVHHAGLLSVT